MSTLIANKMLSNGLGVDENLSYEEVFVEILDLQVKRLKNNEVATIRFYGGSTLLGEKQGRPCPI